MRQRFLLLTGIAFVIFSQIILGAIFYPLISAEIKYRFRNAETAFEFPAVDPLNQDFMLIIPKINLISKVLPNINPFNKTEYLKALNFGIAQAAGSALPNKKGNIFLFAHSTDSPININQYNALFYLINKLTSGDKIYLTYQGRKYEYVVDSTKIISPSEIEYLSPATPKQILTLMTCWPPGTTLKRLLVISHLIP